MRSNIISSQKEYFTVHSLYTCTLVHVGLRRTALFLTCKIQNGMFYAEIIFVVI